MVPPLLSHGGHRHDISGLKGEVFRTCLLPLAIPLYPIPFESPASPTSPPSFLGPASLDAALGQASWGHCHCLHAKQSPSEGRQRKRRASHGTSQELGRLPRPTPLRPHFWLNDAGVTPVPRSPLAFPPVTPSSLSRSLAPIQKNALSLLRGPFERG